MDSTEFEKIESENKIIPNDGVKCGIDGIKTTFNPSNENNVSDFEQNLEAFTILCSAETGVFSLKCEKDGIMYTVSFDIVKKALELSENSSNNES